MMAMLRASVFTVSRARSSVFHTALARKVTDRPNTVPAIARTEGVTSEKGCADPLHGPQQEHEVQQQRDSAHRREDRREDRHRRQNDR